MLKPSPQMRLPLRVTLNLFHCVLPTQSQPMLLQQLLKTINAINSTYLHDWFMCCAPANS